MGIALPLYGYVIPRGRGGNRSDVTAGWNRKAAAAVEKFGYAVSAVSFRPNLEGMVYGGVDLDNPDQIFQGVRLETDLVNRPVLAEILDCMAEHRGSIVVEDIAVILTDESSSSRHRDLLGEIIKNRRPVISVSKAVPGFEPLNRYIRPTGTAPELAIEISGNYSHNHIHLQRHIAQLGAA